MQTFGLIGYPLSHSFSKKYFENKCLSQNKSSLFSYELYPLKDLKLLTKLIETKADLSGLNVTIPYKVEVMDYLDHIDTEAKITGAVNTIKIKKIKSEIFLSGFNTDLFGFEKVLMDLLKKANLTQVKTLILGTGGASKAVQYVLNKFNFEFLCVSRQAFNDQSVIDYKSININLLEEYKLIINTTPLGMFPEINQFPDIPYHLLTKDHILFDMVYNPSNTIFMKKGIELGAMVENGYRMLCLQADRSWEIWNDPNL